jgi:hypothetical protein
VSEKSGCSKSCTKSSTAAPGAVSEKSTCPFSQKSDS